MPHFLDAIAKLAMDTGREIIVEDSCGCVFCDMNLEPEMVDGKPVHVTHKHGPVACTREPTK